jgi:predicted  nucleic acid-binding Zn-ribbon protein
MKGGHGFFNQLDMNYMVSVRRFFDKFPGTTQEDVKNSSGKVIAHKQIWPELSTYNEIKDKIIKQSEEIKELQEKIKNLEDKMKNNSNNNSVNTTRTFYTAKSKGGKRKTQKKQKV